MIIFVVVQYIYLRAFSLYFESCIVDIEPFYVICNNFFLRTTDQALLHIDTMPFPILPIWLLFLPSL